jgi:hypothetical protein
MYSQISVLIMLNIPIHVQALNMIDITKLKVEEAWLVHPVRGIKFKALKIAMTAGVNVNHKTV